MTGQVFELSGRFVTKREWDKKVERANIYSIVVTDWFRHRIPMFE